MPIRVAVSEKQKITAGEDGEKLEQVRVVGESVKWRDPKGKCGWKYGMASKIKHTGPKRELSGLCIKEAQNSQTWHRMVPQSAQYHSKLYTGKKCKQRHKHLPGIHTSTDHTARAWPRVDTGKVRTT